MRLTPLFLLLALCLSAAPVLAREPVFHTHANVMVELNFTAQRAYADPFNDLSLDLVVIDPSGRELRVPAFWDGGNTWKARYASPLTGTHTFRTECSNPADSGLHGLTGRIEISPYTGDNTLYTHGPLQVSPDRRFLEHADGRPFFWLGDTWWMGLCHRLHWPDEFQQLTADRKAKGFTVIQIVAGLYPDMFPFDPRGANEAGFPWQTNYTAIRPEYFDAADQRLLYLVDQGFTPCIVGAWGYFMPWMGVEKMKAHWRNLIARYGALPVVWCAAGEANLPWYLAKGFPYDDREQIHKWTEVLRYIRDTDPWHRPLTLHPTGIGPLTARHSTDDPGLIDFDMLQTPHARQEGVPITVQTVRNSYAATPTMPVIDGEASYEMLSDSLPTEWTRRMFWVCMMNGAAGHTYGANGIWQCNRPGQPHGKSPHGGTYGTIPWNKAMNLPGSSQVGFGKKLFEQFAWQDFRPHPEWVHWSGTALTNASWIWYPEGNPAVDAPAAKRWFRKEFILTDGNPAARAALRVSADDRFIATLNGHKLGEGADWNSPRQFNDIAQYLRPGKNEFVIEAQNMPAPSANPAGMIAALEVKFADHTTTHVATDNTWESAQSESGPWTNAMSVAPYGAAPWGRIDAPADDILGPQATGIPGIVSVLYVPRPDPIEARSLGPRALYQARYFDPVTGATTPLNDIRSDDHGVWNCPPPPGIDHDWVLLLELKKEHAAADSHRLTLSNKQLAWNLDWSEATPLKTTSFDNLLTGHRFEVSDDRELQLTFSAAPDRLAEPIQRVDDFLVCGSHRIDAQQAEFELCSATFPIKVTLHFELDGATRRKWAEVQNNSSHDLLLLDANLDDFTTPGAATGGGSGMPVFIEGEAFAAINHPAGVNTANGGRVQLAHHPGKRLRPGEVFDTHPAIVTVAAHGQARAAFVDYIQSKSLRPKKFISAFTPFGMNNQWGACPTLDDQETLDVLRLLEKFRKQGVHFDYFTFDTGWVDPGSDLTKFRPTCFPNGPGEIVSRLQDLDMKLGLWFGTSWATQSCWDYAPAYAPDHPPGLPWREGSPLTEGGINFCFASEPYFSIFKNAVLYHIRENKTRFLKFDGGNYHCDDTSHGHLPGIYSTEAMYNNLIDIARAARAAAPDMYILWYWGVGSPFWALYGDMVFESGLEMEGSGTSSFPTLYYRDSVTLAQDQNAQFATAIPPLVKDSLGVWLSDSRWGNFMGKARWREALVMDLGRGNLFFPNLWGDLYQLDDDDIAFLAQMSDFAKRNTGLFLHRINILGDPALNQPYGYAYGHNRHGVLFMNNANFTGRHVQLPVGSNLGLDTAAGAPLRIVSHFPEQARVLRPDGAPIKSGDTLDLWLRPFETLMLEINPDANAENLPVRRVTDQDAAQAGLPLPLRAATPDKNLDARFADAATFAAKGFKQSDQSYEASLPALGDEPAVLALAIQLRRGDAEWKYAPTVEQIVQPILRIDDENVQMVPVPDGRQYGNTQSFGCSWVVYKFRLPKRWSGRPLQLAIHSWLPAGVQARATAWVVKNWWRNDTRPVADGFYTDAPQ